jgi:hypothetical protein
MGILVPADVLGDYDSTDCRGFHALGEALSRVQFLCMQYRGRRQKDPKDSFAASGLFL